MAKKPNWKADLVQNTTATINRKDESKIPEKGYLKNTISLQDIKFRSNVRDDYSNIEELARSIKDKGLIQPIRLTKDNFLIAGHRRLKAFEYGIENYNEFPEKIPCSYDVRISEAISDIEWEQLQLAENEEREDLDNFDLCNLYCKKLEQGFKQKDICEIYSKPKGMVSNIIKIRNMHPTLKKYCKEFQESAWSKAKYSAEYSAGFDDKTEMFYESNRTILGWKPLYSISKHDNLSNQIKEFLKLFKARLTEEELKNDLFGKYSAEYLEKKNENLYKSTLKVVAKKTDSIYKIVTNLIHTDDENVFEIKALKLKLDEIQDIMSTLILKHDAHIISSTRTVHSTKVQTTTTTSFEIEFNKSTIDLTQTVKTHGLPLTLWAIIDLVFYNRKNGKTINKLKSLVENNLKTGKAQKTIPDSLNIQEDQLNPEIIAYVKEGCPSSDELKGSYSESTLQMIFDLYADKKVVQ